MSFLDLLSTQWLLHTPDWGQPLSIETTSSNTTTNGQCIYESLWCPGMRLRFQGHRQAMRADLTIDLLKIDHCCEVCHLSLCRKNLKLKLRANCQLIRETLGKRSVRIPTSILQNGPGKSGCIVYARTNIRDPCWQYKWSWWCYGISVTVSDGQLAHLNFFSNGPSSL